MPALAVPPDLRLNYTRARRFEQRGRLMGWIIDHGAERADGRWTLHLSRATGRPGIAGTFARQRTAKIEGFKILGAIVHEAAPAREMRAPKPVLVAGQVWHPTRPGSKARPRTIVWAGDMPSTLKFAKFVTEPTVGYVNNPAQPGFPESGHDSWITVPGFQTWIRRHLAVCEPLSAQ